MLFVIFIAHNCLVSEEINYCFVFLLTAFVHFTFPSTRLRYFSSNETEGSWTDSLTRCRQNNETPVTLYDEEDGMFTVNFTYDKSVWLGLRKARNITWSDGSPVTFNKSSVDVTNGTQRCQAIENNTWKDYDCSTLKYFMCEPVLGKFDLLSFLCCKILSEKITLNKT